ncbi:MAG: hypothetical protein GZ086_04275 [Gelidibacter sp.]|nr:hypothetical protein [Gelidibacter sp.]
MKTIKRTVLLFIPKKLIGLRKGKVEIDGLDFNLHGLEEDLYFRSNRH